MRPALWTCILIGAAACSAAYPLFISPAWSPNFSMSAPDQSGPQPEVLRPQDVESSLPALKPDQLSVHQPDEHRDDTTEVASLDMGAPETGVAVIAEPKDKKKDLTYLFYYAYSEIPPETSPAATVLDSLKDVLPGTPVEEIKRVSDALRLNFPYMKAIADIESSFNPEKRTGSYIGLFQLSAHEFRKYGSGNIRDARDNAVAAAFKIMTEAMLFETFTHKKPTLDDLYLIHQQGLEGAIQHTSYPRRLAWQSMCATDEGKEKGEKWCKRAIWGNITPAIKRIWKKVDSVTSGAFVAMWQQRVADLYARYAGAGSNGLAAAKSTILTSAVAQTVDVTEPKTTASAGAR
jgi:hypothetical protein